MAVAQVPGLKLQRQESFSFWHSYSFCSSCLWASHVARGGHRAPDSFGGPLDRKYKILVSCVQIQGPMPPPHQSPRPQCMGVEMVLAWEMGVLSLKMGQTWNEKAEISISHRSSQTPASHANQLRYRECASLGHWCLLLLISWGGRQPQSPWQGHTLDFPFGKLRLSQRTPQTEVIQSTHHGQRGRAVSPPCLQLAMVQVQGAERVLRDRIVNASHLHI